MKKIIVLSIGLLLFFSTNNFCKLENPDEPRILFDYYRGFSKSEWRDFQSELKDIGFTIDFLEAEINTTILSKENYDVFVIWNPSFRYTDDEKDAIRSFVKSGGGLIIFGFLEKCSESICGEIDLTNKISHMFGITFNSDTVYDSENNWKNQNTDPIITTFVEHPVTEGLESIVYDGGCSLTVRNPAVPLAFGNVTSQANGKKGKDIIILAYSEYGKGKVCGMGTGWFLCDIKSCMCLYGQPDIFSLLDNKQLGLNMFKWASGKFQDSDNDGIIDRLDDCYNPHCQIIDARGCPQDSDYDGVNDCDDECPQETGPSDNKGCPIPDEDTDSIPDDEDDCYNPGCTIVDAQGCPKDSDKDGLNDCEDVCPSEYGEQEHDGCPEKDSDDDGVPDDEDDCYNPGCTIVDAQGCPKDSDKDGLNDCEDVCPNQSGPSSNDGCPEEQKDEGGCMGTLILSFYIILGIVFINRKKNFIRKDKSQNERL